MRSTELLVETDGGLVGGTREGDVSVFRGVSFARAPTGDRRMCAPEPVEPWSGVRGAREFGNAVPQVRVSLGTAIPAAAMDVRGREDEDALHLNVWTPSADDAKRRVLVWFHGGGLVEGAGSQPWYDGALLATRGDIVVVTVNYRLGVLGWLHLADILPDREGVASNAGMLDQIAALRWVQANIAAFGGDPDNVTIAGQSAGARSVAALLAAPSARGLFSRAIAQSGAFECYSRAEAGDLAEQALDAMGLTARTSAELWRLEPGRFKVATAALLNNPRSPALTNVFQHIVDGDVLPRAPIDAVRAGEAAPVPLLLGATAEEARLARHAAGIRCTEERDVVAALEFLPGGADIARLLVDGYRDAMPEADAEDLYVAIESDKRYGIASVRLAEASASAGAPTWSYRFAWRSPDPQLGACHCIDLAFVFGTFDIPGMDRFSGTGDAAARLCTQVQSAWLSFVRTGDPTAEAPVEWPEYEPSVRNILEFGNDGCATVRWPADSILEAWSAVAAAA